MQKEFYCPLYEGTITQHDCDELCMGVNFNQQFNDGLPPLMRLEQIRAGKEKCIKCQVKKNTNYSTNPEVIKRIEALEEKYKDDIDALEVIERDKTNIAYLERKQREDGYEGQTPIQSVMGLERHLLDWH